MYWGKRFHNLSIITLRFRKTRTAGQLLTEHISMGVYELRDVRQAKTM